MAVFFFKHANRLSGTHNEKFINLWRKNWDIYTSYFYIYYRNTAFLKYLLSFGKWNHIFFPQKIRSSTGIRIMHCLWHNSERSRKDHHVLLWNWVQIHLISVILRKQLWLYVTQVRYELLQFRYLLQVHCRGTFTERK